MVDHQHVPEVTSPVLLKDSPPFDSGIVAIIKKNDSKIGPLDAEVGTTGKKIV